MGLLWFTGCVPIPWWCLIAATEHALLDVACQDCPLQGFGMSFLGWKIDLFITVLFFKPRPRSKPITNTLQSSQKCCKQQAVTNTRIISIWYFASVLVTATLQTPAFWPAQPWTVNSFSTFSANQSSLAMVVSKWTTNISCSFPNFHVFSHVDCEEAFILQDS